MKGTAILSSCGVYYFRRVEMSENKVKRENYITIQGFMLTDLKLKGNELLIYACIYGFSQAENQVFNGSLQYLADWTNSTKQGVIKCLKSLEEKQFIFKKENFINGVKFCEYYTTKFNTPLNNVDRGIQQSLIPPVKQSLPNNISNNNIYNNIFNNKDNNIECTHFKKPTLEEVEEYCNERQNNIDPQRFIDYYTANGWKVGRNSMKDWKAAVRTWERSNNDKPAKNKTQGIIDEMQEALNAVKMEIEL